MFQLADSDPDALQALATAFRELEERAAKNGWTVAFAIVPADTEVGDRLVISRLNTETRGDLYASLLDIEATLEDMGDRRPFPRIPDGLLTDMFATPADPA